MWAATALHLGSPFEPLDAFRGEVPGQQTSYMRPLAGNAVRRFPNVPLNQRQLNFSCWEMAGQSQGYARALAGNAVRYFPNVLLGQRQLGFVCRHLQTISRAHAVPGRCRVQRPRDAGRRQIREGKVQDCHSHILREATWYESLPGSALIEHLAGERADFGRVAQSEASSIYLSR